MVTALQPVDSSCISHSINGNGDAQTNSLSENCIKHEDYTTSSTHKLTDHKGVSILIPSNLNIRKLLIENPISLRSCVDNIYQQEDKVAVLISTIINGANKSIRFNNGKTGQFAQISSRVMQKKVHDYKDYITYLSKHGVIISDDHYIPDTKSKSFKLTERYRNANLTEYMLYNHNGNIKKGASVYNSYITPSDKQKDTMVKYSDLYQDLLKVTVTDLNKGKNYIYGPLTFSKYPKYKVNDVLPCKIKEVQNCWYSSLHDIKNGQLYFTQDDTSFRLHTSVLATKSECRSFLNLDNKGIVSCDLKNSQPFLSSYFFTKAKTCKELDHIVNNVFKDLKKANPSMYSSVIKRIKNYKKGNIQKSTQKYLDLVKDGKLYEFIADNLGLLNTFKFNRKINYNRKKGKKMVFNILFRPNKFQHLAKDIFKINFPQVAALFNDINTLFTHTRSEALKSKLPFSKNTLAIALQSIESYLILDVICKEIKDKYNHIPLLTVHDAIATNSEYSSLVKSEMDNTITTYIGQAPTISYETWSS